MFTVLLLLSACGGSASSTAEPPPAPKPVAVAPTPPAAPAVVGPDGPDSIPLPASLVIPTDPAAAAEGERLFGIKGCAGCHAWGSRLVGPDLTGVSDRRSPAWLARMIQHPDRMVKEDPVAKKLFAEAMTPMADQKVSDAELLQLLAFFQTKR